VDKKIFIPIFLLFSLNALSNLNVMWDEAIYLMNARYFSGQRVFVELIRPPLLSFLLIPFQHSLIASRLVYSLFALSCSFLAYEIAEFYGKEKQGLLAASLIAVNPLFFVWSHNIYTEIPSTALALASVLFLLRYLKGKEKIHLHLALFLASLSFLTRYVMGILLVSELLVLFAKKKFGKDVFLGLFLASIPILIWLGYNHAETGDPFYSFKWGLYWGGYHPSDPLTYLKSLHRIFSLQLLLLPLAFRKENRSRILLVTFVLLFLTSHQLFSHKEERYLLPIIPFVLLLSSFGLKERQVKYAYLLVFLCLVLDFIYFEPINCGKDAFSKVGELEGRVLSTGWPLTAYYSDVPVKAFPPDPQDLNEFIEEYNITYIVTSDVYGWPDYAKRPFEYELVGNYSDLCKQVWVYKVS